MLVFDHSLPISGFPVDVAHKERDLVLRVEAVPQQIGKLRGGAAGDFHLLRFPHKGGQGGAVAHVGVDEMALPGAGGLIGEEIPAAGGGIAVRALEDGEGVVAVLFYQPGDTGGVVGGVGLKGSGVEGLGKGLARGQPLADGVGLVAVGDDGGGAEHPHRGVDNKGGVAWKIPELRKKILFTVFALLIFRLGSVVPVPFIDSNMLGATLNNMGGIFTLLGAMNGTAFSMAAVFALGVQPYINSSIIIQLLTVAIPALERLQKEGGEEGRKKIAAITRYVTVAIGLLQGFGYYTLIRTQGGGTMLDTAGLPGWWAGIVIVLCFTAGSAFVMWLGEQITEFGIGNGISIILFAGILSRGPSMIRTMYQGVRNNLDGVTGEGIFNLPVWAIPLILIGMLAIVVLIVFIQNAERRIPVQYAKRVVGRKMYGGQSSHIPLKVNMTGVMPIIFAQAIASLPATIAAFAGVSKNDPGFWGGFLRVFDTTSIFYIVVYFLLIVGFSFFYSTMQFNPVEVANNLKKNGGFIPGFRPGKPTADFIHKVLNKITMFGALYLAIIAIAPIVTGAVIGVSSLAIGGTSIIIVVGVALETTKALEAQMLMRHYKGFLE